LCLAWAWHATTPLLATWPHAAVGAYAAAAGLARPASDTSERPDPGIGEEARWLGGGGHGEWVARWRRPQRADATVQVSGAVERGVGKLDGAVEAKRGREVFFLNGHVWEHSAVVSAGAASVYPGTLTRALPFE
jgi:hypothetical protein